MGSISKVIGKTFRYAGDLFGLAGAFWDIFVPGNPTRDFIGGTFDSVASIFDPLPPEFDHRALKRDLQLSGTSEGDELPLIMGQNCRVPGALIWIGKVTKSVKDSTGGKGAGADFSDPKVKTNADLIYLVSENPLGTGGTIREVRGSGFTVWRKDSTLTIVDDVFTVTAGTFAGGLPKLTITSPKSGQDISVFEVGQDLTLSGFNAANNGTWRCIKAQYAKKTGISTLQLKDPTNTKVPVNQSPGFTGTIAQPLPDVKKAMESGTVLTGSATQTAPAEYVAFEEFAPGYRLRAGFFMKQLNVLKVTSLLGLEFYVNERSATLTLSQAVDMVMTYRSDLQSAQWNSTALTGTVPSYVVPGSSGLQALLPLMIAYEFSFRDDNGVLVFFHNNTGTVITLDPVDMAAMSVNAGEDTQHPVDLKLRDHNEFPFKCTVAFNDINNEMQRATVSQVRYGTTSSKETTVDLTGLGLSHADARKIAKRELYAPEARKIITRISTLPKYLGIRHDDVLNTTIDDTTYPLRVGRVEETDDYLLTIDAHTQINGVPYTAPNQTTVGTKDSQTSELVTHSWLCGPLKDEHTDTSGFYFACTRTDETVDWEGATLYKLLPGGEYVAVENVTKEGTVGYYISGESVWSVSNGPVPFTWDRKTEIVIQFLDPNAQLESRTEDEVLAGANRLQWGAEDLIGFVNATNLGSGKYKLTKIVHGLRGTNWASGVSPRTHTDGETCTLINDGVFFRQEAPSELDKLLTYKLVPANSLIEDTSTFVVDLKTIVIGGSNLPRGTLTPFTVTHVKSVGDAANDPIWPFAVGVGTGEDITLKINRRTRSLTHVFRAQPIPLAEEIEKYEVLVQGEGGIQRQLPQGAKVEDPYGPTSFVFSDDPTLFVYYFTFNDHPQGSILDTQEEDGWDVGPALTVKVRQISSIAGSGPQATFILTNGILTQA